MLAVVHTQDAPVYKVHQMKDEAQTYISQTVLNFFTIIPEC